MPPSLPREPLKTLCGGKCHQHDPCGGLSRSRRAQRARLATLPQARRKTRRELHKLSTRRGPLRQRGYEWLPGDAPRLRPGGSPSCGVRSGLCARFPTEQSSRPDAQPIHSHPSPSTIQTRFGWAFFGAAVAVRFPIQRGFGWASGPDPRLSLAPEKSRRTVPFPARPRPRSRNAV